MKIKNKEKKGQSFVSKSLEDTENIARRFVEELKDTTRAEGARGNAFVVAMYGNLGSGKTTFVKFTASAFGIKNTVTSPTFVIEKIYPIRNNGHLKRPTFKGTGKLENQNFDNLIHIDAYRLKNGEELKSLGWDDIYKNPRNIIFIEWPENIKDIIPKDAKQIEFDFIDENTRAINLC